MCGLSGCFHLRAPKETCAGLRFGLPEVGTDREFPPQEENTTFGVKRGLLLNSADLDIPPKSGIDFGFGSGKPAH